MKSRIVSEKDLGEAINMLMAGNIPASTADVINLVQRLQSTKVQPEYADTGEKVDTSYDPPANAV